MTTYLSTFPYLSVIDVREPVYQEHFLDEYGTLMICNEHRMNRVHPIAYIHAGKFFRHHEEKLNRDFSEIRPSKAVVVEQNLDYYNYLFPNSTIKEKIKPNETIKITWPRQFYGCVLKHDDGLSIPSFILEPVPVPIEPKYRPYTIEECPACVVVNKQSKRKLYLKPLSEENCMIGTYPETYIDLLKDYTHLNGEPLGVRIDP